MDLLRRIAEPVQVIALVVAAVALFMLIDDWLAALIVALVVFVLATLIEVTIPRDYDEYDELEGEDIVR